MHNNAFWSNSNAFSLIICKVHTKRENSGSCTSGPGKATSGYLFCTTPNKLKLYGEFLWNIWGILEPIGTRGGPLGGHNPPRRTREPRLTSGAHLLVYKSFWPRKKIRRWLLGWSTAASRRKLGRSTFALRRSDSAGGTSSWRGKSSSSAAPTTLPSWGGQSPSNLQQHHLLSNPSSPVVFNLCTGTLDWCLWVTISVDYIL